MLTFIFRVFKIQSILVGILFHFAIVKLDGFAKGSLYWRGRSETVMIGVFFRYDS